MEIGICVNAASLSRYALEDLGDGRSAFDYVVDYVDTLRRSRSDIVGVTVLLPPPGAAPPVTIASKIPESWRGVAVPEATEASFLELLATIAAEYDHVIYLLGDTPFLDLKDTAELLKLHVDYFAQFTGSDGYPQGALPEVFEGSFPAALRNLAEEGASPPRELFPVVLRDVNAFDVETMVATRDVRPLRVDLSCAGPRGLELCRRMRDRLGTRAEDLAAFIADHQERLRILPAFAAVQLVDAHPQRVRYLPQERMGLGVGPAGDEMARSRFSELVSALERFSPGIVIQASLWGEIALHSSVSELIADMENRSDSSFLVETSGVGWSARDRTQLLEGSLSRTTIVVDLDAASEEVYRELRGEGFAEAVGFARDLLAAHPERVYVRATRMRENAEDIETFYRSWKEETEQVIIRKYDHFAGALPDRRLVDISPMERLPCWHLKRDFYVLLDGSVPMCREDLNGEYLLGNVFEEGVEALWRRNEEYYQRHVRQDFPALCRNCDEYYTFNF